MRQALTISPAENPLWNEYPDDTRHAPSTRKMTPVWFAALTAALVLHLIAASTAWLLWHGRSAPSPGTGARTFDVALFPAWPEPGHHATQLGTAVPASPTKPSTRISGPNTGKVTASNNTTAAKPPPAAAETAMPPPADLPPSTPSAAEALWEEDVLARLASEKRYPMQARRAGEQDTVMVRFVVDRAGHLLSATVIKSRGIATLDAEALALIRRAAPLPAPPPEVSGDMIELVAPVHFILRSTS